MKNRYTGDYAGHKPDKPAPDKPPESMMTDMPESVPKHERRYCELNLPHSWHAPIKYMPDSVLVEINWHEKRWYTDCPMPKDIPFIGPQKYVHDDKYEALQAENKRMREVIQQAKKDLSENYMELNIGNYTEDDVRHLNDAMIFTGNVEYNLKQALKESGEL